MIPQRVEDLTLLSPDIALAHVRRELTGDEGAPGETFEYRKSALFTTKMGWWRIRPLHNTRIRPNANSSATSCRALARTRRRINDDDGGSR